MPSWLLTEPLDAIVFDCDGTLSHMEGINELAKYSGVKSEVEAITYQCMTIGMTPYLYEKRLQLIMPKFAQLLQIAEQYVTCISPNAAEVIDIFKRLNKSVFIVSAGIQQSLLSFCMTLGVPSENLRGVELYFDENGDYLGFDRNSPLVVNDGKVRILRDIKKTHERLAMIGDGITDSLTVNEVERFIGYGGMVVREQVKATSPYFLLKPSLLPLLPLCLTRNEYTMLTVSEKELYQEGLIALNSGDVIMNLMG